MFDKHKIFGMILSMNKKKYCLIALVCACFLGLLPLLSVHPTPPPQISVVMPVYNRPDLVGRAIDSILNQTVTDFEFIIVDDGSDEETKQILKQYAKQDNRIRLLHNSINRGIAFSRQRGVDAARGTYIATMDSDDWSVPDRLAKSLAFMNDYPTVDAMTGTVRRFPDGETFPDYSDLNATYTLNKLPGFYEVELAFNNIFPNVSSFYKRSFVQENHIRYNPSLQSAEDYDFWRQFVLFGAQMASISDTLVFVRSHHSNPSSYYQAMYDNTLEIHRKMFSQFFTPKPEDLKFFYSQREKCVFLSQMLAANVQNPKLPHTYLEDRYQAQCPPNMEEALFLKHQYWSDYLVPTPDRRWKRHAVNDSTADITFESDKIIVAWDKWPRETFYRQSDDSYQFFPAGSKEKFKHEYWTDNIIIPQNPNQKTCRMSEPGEWASVRKVNESTLVLTWDKKEWGAEEFHKNTDGTWVFVSKVPPSDEQK